MKNQGGRGKQILDERKNRARSQKHAIAWPDGGTAHG